jgi:hypothetical protein
MAVLVVTGVQAQQSGDYIKITPPVGMRWKTLNQSAITNDITFVDKDGNIWLRKAAAATFAQSFVLVQLVGDTAGTEQWMEWVENSPRFLGLRPDADWSNYRAFTVNPTWRGLLAEEHQEAKDEVISTGMMMPLWVIAPVYSSASDPSWRWSSPADGPLPPDAVLTGDFRRVVRVKAGTDVPYTVSVENFSTDPPSEVTRPGGYELYRNYYPRFNDDGSLTLTLAGDFSFQKDYLLPEGPPCANGLPRLPDGSCAGNTTAQTCPDGLPPLADGTCPTVVPQPTPAPGTGGGSNSLPGAPPLITPEPAATAPGPLVPSAPPPDTCTAVAGAVLDLCGTAASRAVAITPAVPLPPITIHVNPVRGVVHVPDWFWATGYDGGPESTTRSYSLHWSLPGPPIFDPVTGEVTGHGPGRSGDYHISVTVTYQPSRYRWDFGDGTVIDTSSLGQAYPAATSDVQHSYNLSSLLQPDQLYTYRLIVDWQGSWRVAGDATGSGTVEPRLSIAAAQQEMREVDQLRCPDSGCVN